MWINFFTLLGGLVVLVYSADKFVDGTASIAEKMGVSPLLIGLTIVGLGTSAPEILVATIASWHGNPGLAVGNALGSNIANVGLILGCTALVSPLAVHSRMLKRELPVLLLTSVFCYLLAFDGLTLVDGLLMISGLACFLSWLVWTAKREKNHDIFADEIESELTDGLSMRQAWLFFLVGLIGLLVSSRLLVWASVNIAHHLGISDLVIGLTIVALGTSLPELAASIASVLKDEHDLAVGNVIGSNMYNLLAVYSIPGLIAPGALAESVVSRDFPVMLVFTVALFFMGYGFRKQGRINRLEGLILLLGYGCYQWVVYQSTLTVAA